MECIANEGVYRTPVYDGGVWQNCTKTVYCGQPPEPGINVTRTWVSPAVEGDMDYNTYVTYACQNGSRFEVDEDGDGYYEPTLTIRY